MENYPEQKLSMRKAYIAEPTKVVGGLTHFILVGTFYNIQSGKRVATRPKTQ